MIKKLTNRVGIINWLRRARHPASGVPRLTSSSPDPTSWSSRLPSEFGRYSLALRDEVGWPDNFVMNEKNYMRLFIPKYKILLHGELLQPRQVHT